MRPKIDRDKAVYLYINEHLTCAELAKMFGVSRPAVWKALAAQGVKALQGERVVENCTQCNQEFWLFRGRWRRTRKHFCSTECYYQYIHNPAYQPHRQGQRIGRKVVRQFFPLAPDNVVHHVDGNNDNNDVVNLWVFATNSDHMSFHRGGIGQPIWEGSDPGA